VLDGSVFEVNKAYSSILVMISDGQMNSGQWNYALMRMFLPTEKFGYMRYWLCVYHWIPALQILETASVSPNV
jgi:hypothetical protein